MESGKDGTSDGQRERGQQGSLGGSRSYGTDPAPGSEKGKKQVGGVEGLLQRKSGLSPETTCVLFDPRKPLPVFCPVGDTSAAALSLS